MQRCVCMIKQICTQVCEGFNSCSCKAFIYTRSINGSLYHLVGVLWILDLLFEPGVISIFNIIIVNVYTNIII